MDPNTKRIDSGTPECERLIERGHLALIAITSEAHAAKVAAQKAELEVALMEAQGGDADMLRSWLESYRGMNEAPHLELPTPRPLSAADAMSNRLPIPQERIVHVPDHSSPNQSLSWEPLVHAARERLAARDGSNPSITASISSQVSSLSTSFDAQPLLSEPQTSETVELKNERDSEDLLAKQDEALVSEDERLDQQLHEQLDEYEEEPDEVEPDELTYEDLPELQVLAETDRDLRAPLVRSGTRGLIFSVVVHMALISTLMAITIHVPDQVASLGFDGGTSEADVDSFEVLQPIEVTSTEEFSPEMPSETSESSVSLPSAVGLSSTSVNAASTTAASGMSGVQASANRAVTAASGRPNPSNANASFFGAAASGNCFCYVIDGSESMRGGPWEAAKAELLRSLSTMKASHRFYIIFFNQKLSAITMPGEREPATSPLYATAENLKHAQNWIESLRIERGAPPNDALLHAIEIEPDAIYLLADGATKIDVPAFLRTKNRTSDFISGEQVRVPIHAIAFYSPESGQKLMKQVAVENKGQFIYVPDPRKK